MPAFVVIFDDDDLSVAISEPVSNAHVAHFLALGERAILGGAMLNDEGTAKARLLVGEFASVEEARAFAATEPLVVAGRVKGWRVEPFFIAQERGVHTPSA